MIINSGQENLVVELRSGKMLPLMNMASFGQQQLMEVSGFMKMKNGTRSMVGLLEFLFIIVGYG